MSTWQLLFMMCPLCHKDQAYMHFEDIKSHRVFYICQICDLIFQDRLGLMSIKEEKKRYENHENHLLDEGYRQFLEPSVQAIKQFYQPSLSGLDYGCGPYPALAQILLEQQIEVDIYDPLFFPKKDFSKTCSKKYDFLVSTEVVEHFYDVSKQWQKMFSCLKEKAQVIIMTQRHSELINFPQWHYWRDETHVSFYSEKTLSWIAQKWRFECAFIHDRVVIMKRF